MHKDKIEKSQGPDVNGQPCNEPLASGPDANTASTVHGKENKNQDSFFTSFSLVSSMFVEHGMTANA